MMAILGIFGLALLAVALYQWTLILQQHVDIERVRRESAERAHTVSSNGLALQDADADQTPASAAESEKRRQMTAYVSDVEPLLLMWRDAQARAALADGTLTTGALSTLREVRSRASAVVPPAEAQDVHNRLLACMGRVVEEYEAANRNGAEGGVATRSREACEAFDSVAVEFATLQTETFGHQ